MSDALVFHKPNTFDIDDASHDAPEGLTKEAALAELEKDKDEYRGIAVRRVRLGLLLSEIGQANGIEVSAQEMQRLVTQAAQQYRPQDRERELQHLGDLGLRRRPLVARLDQPDEGNEGWRQLVFPAPLSRRELDRDSDFNVANVIVVEVPTADARTISSLVGAARVMPTLDRDSGSMPDSYDSCVSTAVARVENFL